MGRGIGGAIVGGGIAAMHYTGMAAFEIAGTVAVGSGSGVRPRSCSARHLARSRFPSACTASEEKWKIGGALLLTLAICSHHFTAMGAVSIIPDPTIDGFADRRCRPDWLAVAVALASFVILVLATRRPSRSMSATSRRSELEGERMRDLANAAVEGLAGLRRRDDRLASTTASRRSPGCPAAELVGGTLDKLLSRPGRARQAVVAAQSPGRDGSAPSRRLDDPGRADPAADRSLPDGRTTPSRSAT